MEKNDKKQTRNRISKDGKKIYPTVSYTALNIFDDAGIKYSDALEEYALFIATNNTTLIAKREIAEFKIKMLEQEIKDIESETQYRLKNKQQQLEEAKNELKSIDLTLDNYLAVDSRNMEKALTEVMVLIKKARLKAKNKKWGVKRVSLQEIDDIAKTNHVKLTMLLAKVDDTVKKEWIEI